MATRPLNQNGPANPVYVVDNNGDLLTPFTLTDNAGTAYTVKSATATSTADGEYDVIAAVTGKKIRVLGISCSVITTAGLFQLLDGAGGTVKWQLSLALGTPFEQHVQPPLFLFETTAATKLVGKNAAGVDSFVNVLYVEV